MQDVADSCRTGSATNVIFGLALGYKSCIIPTIAIGCAIYTGNSLAGMYGIATAALGMLGTLATGGRCDLACRPCMPCLVAETCIRLAAATAAAVLCNAVN